MKKFVKITAITLGSLFLLAAAAFLLGWNMVASIQADCDSITPLPLQSLPDGVYRGNGGAFIVQVDLSVTVKSHRIDDIQISSQLCSSKHKALDTTSRIIDAQSADVDATAGATWSSKSIMAAVYKALACE